MPLVTALDSARPKAQGVKRVALYSHVPLWLRMYAIACGVISLGYVPPNLDASKARSGHHNNLSRWAELKQLMALSVGSSRIITNRLQ